MALQDVAPFNVLFGRDPLAKSTHRVSVCDAVLAGKTAKNPPRSAPWRHNQKVPCLRWLGPNDACPADLNAGREKQRSKWKRLRSVPAPIKRSFVSRRARGDGVMTNTRHSGRSQRSVCAAFGKLLGSPHPLHAAAPRPQTPSEHSVSFSADSGTPATLGCLRYSRDPTLAPFVPRSPLLFSVSLCKEQQQ